MPSFLFERRWIAILIAAPGLSAGIASHADRGGTVEIRLDDGRAEVEFVSDTAFRLTRGWGPPPLQRSPVAHQPVKYRVTDAASELRIESDSLVVAFDKDTFRMTVRDLKGAAILRESKPAGRFADRVRLELQAAPSERFYGFGWNRQPGIQLRGKQGTSTRPFFFSTGGYGVFFRNAPSSRYDFRNLAISIFEAVAPALDLLIYQGATPKEILQEHATFSRADEPLSASHLQVLAASGLPRLADPLPPTADLKALTEQLNQESLSGVRYPAVDLNSFSAWPQAQRRRAMQLAAILPLLYDSRNARPAVPGRGAFVPYLLTYLREAYDRGYPMIHPRMFQFSRDPESARDPDWFMVGDEILVAPVLDETGKRKIELPRGSWTDLRGNIRYPGRQVVEVEAPPDYTPLLARNGSVFPLAVQSRNDFLELHYFPNLGGEFFLWEPDIEENTQFHASPVGEEYRLEIETRVDRTYEWIVHHLARPAVVKDERNTFREVRAITELRPGLWFYDSARRNLHVMLEAAKGSDRIVNISF
jgi:alpha-glucosidase (family GH31 glycosyl hydrolase)